MVGYDGSKNSDRALARAAYLAKTAGASLRVVVAVNTTLMAFAPMSPPLPPEVYDEFVSNGRDMLARAMNSAGSLVPSVTGTVEQGNAAEVILRLSEQDGTDLIVLGRRGISGIERFLLGGVSSTVVSHSKCDVLVVR